MDVAHLLHRLSADQARVIVAYAEHGTYTDAAQALGLSYNTFRHRLTQARAAIRGTHATP